jgi:hypothetical protein
MLKKSINPAKMDCDSLKRSLKRERLSENVYLQIHALTGASDYGPFSAYSPSSLIEQQAWVRFAWGCIRTVSAARIDSPEDEAARCLVLLGESA